MTTQYDNETPVSVVYAMADGVAFKNDSNPRHGEVYLVKTNDNGEITDMRLMSKE